MFPFTFICKAGQLIAQLVRWVELHVKENIHNAMQIDTITVGWLHAHSPIALLPSAPRLRRNQHAQHAQQHQHEQQSQHAEVKQHAQEHQHACTCSSIAKPSADMQHTVTQSQ